MAEAETGVKDRGVTRRGVTCKNPFFGLREDQIAML